MIVKFIKNISSKKSSDDKDLRIFSTSQYSLCLIGIAIICIMHSAYGIRESRPTPIDSRIRIMVYHPNDVFKFTGYYGYQAIIELAEGEEVVNMSIGDSTSWQITPVANRIFIKPIEEDATTNMTMITNKRTYFFELYGETTKDIRDPAMVFNVKFLYPDDTNDAYTSNIKSASIDTTPDLSHPEKLNFHYTISGHADIAPIKIFDDGLFTYFQFKNKNKEIPAIFSVDHDLRESIVNFRLNPNKRNMIIIEQVFSKLTLRSGNKIVCVFNESYSM